MRSNKPIIKARLKKERTREILPNNNNSLYVYSAYRDVGDEKIYFESFPIIAWIIETEIGVGFVRKEPVTYSPESPGSIFDRVIYNKDTDEWISARDAGYSGKGKESMLDYLTDDIEWVDDAIIDNLESFVAETWREGRHFEREGNHYLFTKDALKLACSDSGIYNWGMINGVLKGRGVMRGIVHSVSGYKYKIEFGK